MIRRKLKKKTIKNARKQSLSIRYSAWFSPYLKRKNRKGEMVRKTTLPFITKAKCGVYVIRSKRTKKILYVGYSGSQLYKTLYRHFQDWRKSNQYRAEYRNPNQYEVMVILTQSCVNASALEQYYINKLEPRDGIIKLLLSPEEIRFSGAISPEKIDDIMVFDQAPF
ncbi:MAG: GIY-YIG nuclease family protein [Bacteroidota bacterium]